LHRISLAEVSEEGSVQAPDSHKMVKPGVGFGFGIYRGTSLIKNSPPP
jgi:hypothetical protein